MREATGSRTAMGPAGAVSRVLCFNEERRVTIIGNLGFVFDGETLYVRVLSARKGRRKR